MTLNTAKLDAWITGNYGEDHPDNQPATTDEPSCHPQPKKERDDMKEDRSIATIREALEGARRDATEAAEYLDHTRGELVRLIEQAGARERTATTLRKLLAHVIAAGIKVEQASGGALVGIEYLGGQVDPEPLRFAGDIARPAVTS